jgi:hypothetical protein
MTQSQSQHPLLRIGSIAILAGAIIVIISTTIHASTEDSSNHSIVFAEYANDNSWIAVHIGQFAGGIIVFAGGFVALFHLLVQSGSTIASILSWQPNNHNWYLLDNLFCLGWNPGWSYVEKIMSKINR